MKQFFAVQFTTDAEGIAISYFIVPYGHFLRDVKNKGYKTHLNGFKTTEAAEADANTFIGLPLVDTLQARAESVQSSQEAEETETDDTADNGNQQPT